MSETFPEEFLNSLEGRTGWLYTEANYVQGTIVAARTDYLVIQESAEPFRSYFVPRERIKLFHEESAT